MLRITVPALQLNHVAPVICFISWKMLISVNEGASRREHSALFGFVHKSACVFLANMLQYLPVANKCMPCKNMKRQLYAACVQGCCATNTSNIRYQAR